MTLHDDRIYLRQMLSHAQTALEIASDKDRSALETDPMFRYALLHLISILGEAATRVSDAFRLEHPLIAWRNIIGMRNMVIHGYDVVDLDVLWKTVEEDVPDLIKKLQCILNKIISD